MAWCDDCDRGFVSERALQQHYMNAAAHRFHCQYCDQDFPHARALEQHEDNSIKHLKRIWDYVCEPCKLGWDRVEQLEKHYEEVHHWCKMHNRFFNNANNLRQHKLSRDHGASKTCPGCSSTFPTYHALSLHLESGTCPSGANRRRVDQYVHAQDRGGMVTRKLIGYGEWEPEDDIWATEQAWNGWAWECYFCDNEYSTLGKLNGHITQVHAQKRTQQIYHCPGCQRGFTYFSALMGHIETSEACTIRQDRRLRGLFRRTLTMR